MKFTETVVKALYLGEEDMREVRRALVTYIRWAEGRRLECPSDVPAQEWDQVYVDKINGANERLDQIDGVLALFPR